MSLPRWWFPCLVIAEDGGRGLFSRATNCGRGMSACNLPDREVLPAEGSGGCARWLGCRGCESEQKDV